jgi:hypothetical protein
MYEGYRIAGRDAPQIPPETIGCRSPESALVYNAESRTGKRKLAQ